MTVIEESTSLSPLSGQTVSTIEDLNHRKSERVTLILCSYIHVSNVGYMFFFSKPISSLVELPNLQYLFTVFTDNA